MKREPNTTNDCIHMAKGVSNQKRAIDPAFPGERLRQTGRTSRDPAVLPATRAGQRSLLPESILTWFAERGWSPRPHQLRLVAQAGASRSTLLIAPTGSGKTLAGFLPSLVDLVGQGKRRKGAGLHTLYISPLKALAVDVARNLTVPVSEMGLNVRIETRSGDTSASKRQRQRVRPPDILLTTPEQLALLVSHEDAAHLFSGLKTVVLDELHAMVASKRGDLLALDLARLRVLAPDLFTLGLSATVARPSELRAYLVCQAEPGRLTRLADLVQVDGGCAPEISILESDEPMPWSGHTSRYAVRALYAAVKLHRTTLLFVNTRSQAELLFQELWRVNDDDLPIALHHGSLEKRQRQKVEAAMAAGTLKAVVCTSTLDLGIDWGNVDLVINVGAPKGASRLIQRIGRSNHRLDEPSKALLVPSNRFEVLECHAALDAAMEGSQDTSLAREGALDVLAQHVICVACSGPFTPDALFAEIRTAAPYTGLSRERFDRIVEFVRTGGYALRTYERYARLRPAEDGRLRLTNPRQAHQHRLNFGTIVDTPLVKVRLLSRGDRLRSVRSARLNGGRVLGEIDEYFVGELKVGDAFVFAGQVVRFEGIRDMDVYVSKAVAQDPLVPSYVGGKFPLSTHLASRVRTMLATGDVGDDLPGQVREWLGIQAANSVLPKPDEVLIETFPRGPKHYLVAYSFEGRLAHQTLGMLLTRRLQRAQARPLGFVANDYAISVWCGADLNDLIASGRLKITELFAEDMLGDDLEAWLAESNLMKRTFRTCAVIAGLIERRHPGKTKTGRQMTASSDLIYDVLRRHDPHHVLLEAAWMDASTGLLDIGRLGAFLRRIKGHIRHAALSRVSPLAVPILLEIGRESVHATSADDLLREATSDILVDSG
ncbi:MAG: ligase-associated DNA damage response DEXH box helicase [Hyphomicrobiaceae bacterium]